MIITMIRKLVPQRTCTSSTIDVVGFERLVVLVPAIGLVLRPVVLEHPCERLSFAR